MLLSIRLIAFKVKFLHILAIAGFFGFPVGALADTCQFNSQPPMPCSISYKGGDADGIGRTMTISWRDGVTQVYRQYSTGGLGMGGRFYLYKDIYGGEWLWGKPTASSRFGLHHNSNGKKIYFW
jgi:hypothetical protein